MQQTHNVVCPKKHTDDQRLHYDGVGPVIAHITAPTFLQDQRHKLGRKDVPYPFDKQVESVCWWDGHEFAHPPVGCPVHHDTIKNAFRLQGYFCSWSCVRAYAQHYMPNERGRQVGEHIFAVIKALTGQYHRLPAAAPHWSLLRRFGGPMAIEEFRHANGDNDSALVYTTAPETRNLYMTGFDCFITNPKLPVPLFGEPYVHQYADSEGNYQFPRHGDTLRKPQSRPQTTTTKQKPNDVDPAVALSAQEIIGTKRQRDRRSQNAMKAITNRTKRAKGTKKEISNPLTDPLMRQRNTNSAVLMALKINNCAVR